MGERESALAGVGMKRQVLHYSHNVTKSRRSDQHSPPCDSMRVRVNQL